MATVGDMDEPDYHCAACHDTGCGHCEGSETSETPVFGVGHVLVAALGTEPVQRFYDEEDLPWCGGDAEEQALDLNQVVGMVAADIDHVSDVLAAAPRMPLKRPYEAALRQAQLHLTKAVQSLLEAQGFAQVEEG